jgi:phage tail-like protein
VTFYTRVDVLRPVPGYSLGVSLPEGIILESYHPSPGDDGVPPRLVQDGDKVRVFWHKEGPLKADTSYDYQIIGLVAPIDVSTMLESQAVVHLESSEGSDEQSDDAYGYFTETACVHALAIAEYLKYLPALYEADELMGQMLMLFESFLAPIERTIDQLPFFFDPRTAPPDLLPWLASWFDLVLDERWPESKRRQLLRSAVPLYRRRGTCRGMRDYLEIYTGRVPQIVEHRAHNFVLGPNARLGPAVALGTQNEPHTFAVALNLPPVVGDAEGTAAREKERRQVIERIIEAEKPAHMAYTLQVETGV